MKYEQLVGFPGQLIVKKNGPAGISPVEPSGKKYLIALKWKCKQKSLCGRVLADADKIMQRLIEKYRAA